MRQRDLGDDEGPGARRGLLEAMEVGMPPTGGLGMASTA